MSEQKRQRSGIVGPVLLLIIGTILLLNTIGALEWSIWWRLIRLWPVLLIAAGLDLLLGRRSGPGRLLAAILVIVLLVGAVLVAQGTLLIRSGALTSAEIRQPLEAAQSAEISIKPAVGVLRLTALPESANLVEGTIHHAKGEDWEQDLSVSGSRAIYALHTNQQNWAPMIGSPALDRTWELGLSPAPVLDLRLELGAGEHDLDLTGLSVGEFLVFLGVGRTRVHLPAAGRYEGNVDGAVGVTEIVVPQGLGVRVQLDTALAGRNLPDDWAEEEDGVYVSPDYSTAASRVDLSVDQAVGFVTIRVTE